MSCVHCTLVKSILPSGTRSFERLWFRPDTNGKMHRDQTWSFSRSKSAVYRLSARSRHARNLHRRARYELRNASICTTNMYRTYQAFEYPALNKVLTCPDIFQTEPGPAAERLGKISKWLATDTTNCLTGSVHVKPRRTVERSREARDSTLGRKHLTLSTSPEPTSLTCASFH